jgi:TolB-like protein/TPR repeat protein
MALGGLISHKAQNQAHLASNYKKKSTSMRNILAQMRQRSVFRVATAYIVAGWVILEFGSLLFDNFGAPDWVIKVFTTVIFLGFPIACLTAWALEVTPQGIRVTSADDPEASAVPRHSDWIWGGLLALTLVVASGNYLHQWQADNRSVNSVPAVTTEGVQGPGQPGIQPQTTPSVAVLPFVDLSESKDQQYLGNGISEELLNALVSVGGINVAARTSSFSFHGKDVAISEIGSTLGVNHVLEGSVRRGGGRLRITAQLIDVESGFHLFSRSYDRDTADLFAVQNEIAQEIVAALLPSLGLSQQTQLVNQRTTSQEAYDLRLKARYAFFHATPGSLGKSVHYLRQAVEVDPEYWSAWGDLAYTNAYISIMMDDPVEYLATGLEAATRALEHQPDTVTALSAKAVVNGAIYYDYEGAELLYRRAYELGSDLGYWSFVYSFNLLYPLGRYQEAIELLEAAVANDPLATTPLASLLVAYRLLGRMGDAERIADQLFTEQEPAAWFMHICLTYIALGRMQDAAITLEKIEQAMGKDYPGTQLARIQLHSAQGGRDAIQSLLDELLEKRRSGQRVSPLIIGIAYSRLGDEDKAIDWFRQAVDRRATNAPLMLGIFEREFTSIDNNPRFQGLLERMNLPLELKELARKYPTAQGDTDDFASVPH